MCPQTRRHNSKRSAKFRARQKGDSKREKPDPERTFSQIFADFRWFSARSVNQGIWESQICAENRRKPQIFAGNRRKTADFCRNRFLPICCLPFGALLQFLERIPLQIINRFPCKETQLASYCESLSPGTPPICDSQQAPKIYSHLWGGCKFVRAACLQNETAPEKPFKSIRKTVWKTRKNDPKRDRRSFSPSQAA